MKDLSHAGSAATSTLLGCRCPCSHPRHLPWDGSSHPLVWRLPAETISRADLGEVSLMSTLSPNILQVSGCSDDTSHGRAVSSHSRISLRYPRDSPAPPHRACRQLTSIRVTFACLYETPLSKYKERLATAHSPGKAINSSAGLVTTS